LQFDGASPCFSGKVERRKKADKEQKQQKERSNLWSEKSYQPLLRVKPSVTGYFGFEFLNPVVDM